MFRTLLTLLVFGSATLSAQVQRFDIVLAGGRVIDPETGLDAVRFVGINGSTIAAISSSPLEGDEVIDVSVRFLIQGGEPALIATTTPLNGSRPASV